MSNKRFARPAMVLAAALIVHLAHFPRFADGQDSTGAFDLKEVMIPMRDGVRLNTDIYSPKAAHGPLPMIMIRTPYGVEGWGQGQFKSYLNELIDEQYIFVFQDIRGRFKSEGQFVMIRKPRDKGESKAIDESTDAYDTIDWLTRNVPGNNGRVGMLGVSYDGWLTVMAMLDPHPALRAVSPQASPADMFLGDDFHHNGAFRLSYGFEYATIMETTKEISSFSFDRYDTFEWYLALGPLSNADDKYLHGKIPTWTDFVDHPNYDSFWRKQALAPYLNRVTVPTLNVAGWYDQEDFYGPIEIYELLEKHDDYRKNFLVVGPWDHGGWAEGNGSKLGNVDFGGPTSDYFRKKIQAPFFAYYLKDRGPLNQPEAITFQTGSNKWEVYDSWPPKTGIEIRNLYFRDSGKLSFTAPVDVRPAQYDAYVSDPANPVPYRPRPVRPTYPGPEWTVWLLQDQRFVQNRPDVLSWETAALENDFVVSGDIVADLFASTSGTDSDWIVKLIDVYPDRYPADPKMGGYQLIVADEVFRGRFRQSFETPKPIVPNQVNEYSIDLHTNNHAFLKGHKIMVQIQSTWFPLIDRNPQKFVENIFKAKESDFQTAEQRIFRTAQHPSHITLPVARPKEH
jgi:putative CocE/NonD family hydrolase